MFSLLSRLPRLTWPLLLLTAICILWVDQPVALLLKSSTPYDVHVFFKSITDLALAAPYFALMAIGFAAAKWILKNKNLGRSFATGFLSLLTTGLAVNVLKVVFGRRRPFDQIGYDPWLLQPLNFDWNFHSFPSGHSQVAFALAALASWRYPAAKWFFLACAILLAASRVITTAHFISDTLVGSYIGWYLTVLVICRRHQSRAL